jgi:hypothetical protein
MRKILFSLLALIIAAFGFAQKPAEAGIISDNDLYTSSVNDKYYTNGFELFYRYLGKNENTSINKKITEFRLGQYIYNPHTRLADNINVNDRPFAGYVFVEAGRNFFYQNESVLKITAQVGYIGPNSFARESQEFFHDVFGYKRVYGWQHQIGNALAVQGGLLFSKKVFSKEFSQNIDFHIQANGNAGTIFTNVSVGILSRISLKKLLPVYNSNLYDAAVNSNKQVYRGESEFYFYIHPGVNYQLYDATIQGSLFSNNSPVTFDLVPLRFVGEAGFKFRKNKWDLSYSFIYKGKEVDNAVNTGYFYGSIVIGHLLY